MNYIDLIIVLIFAFNIFDGFRRGFIAVLFDLLGFLFALYLAAKFTVPLTKLLDMNLKIPEIFSFVAAFFGIWCLVQLIFYLIFRFGYLLIPKSIKNSLVNKISGIAPSLTKGLVIIGLTLLIIVSLPLNQKYKNPINNSFLGKSILNLFSFWQDDIENAFGQTLPATSVQLTTSDGQKQINLNFKVNDPGTDVESEEAMFKLVNDERVEMGLKPLKYDSGLTQLARNYSAKMFKEGFFAHNDPSGQTPLDRFLAAHINFQAMGENLALAPSVKTAHEGLMNSSEHKENILSPDFGRIGIGVSDGGYYGKMFVQEFAD